MLFGRSILLPLRGSPGFAPGSLLGVPRGNATCKRCTTEALFAACQSGCCRLNLNRVKREAVRCGLSAGWTFLSRNFPKAACKPLPGISGPVRRIGGHATFFPGWFHGKFASCRRYSDRDFEQILSIINGAAQAYSFRYLLYSLRQPHQFLRRLHRTVAPSERNVAPAMIVTDCVASVFATPL